MALTMPFRRNERFPALREARQFAETRAQRVVEGTQQVVELVEQRLPGRRRQRFWERPFVRALFGTVVAAGTLAAAVAVYLRQQAADPNAREETRPAPGLASTRTEAYDAQRAAGDGGTDTVEQATEESFPASDAPVWGSGPDVPLIREGEHKEELPYQRS